MNLSVFNMMAEAGLVVKLVILILLFFSVGSWWIVIAKYFLYNRTRRASEQFLAEFWESKTLNNAYDSAKSYSLSPEASVFVSGFNELRKISTARNEREQKPETLQMKMAIMDNLKRAVRKAQLVELERLQRSLGFWPPPEVHPPSSDFLVRFGVFWSPFKILVPVGGRVWR